MKVFKFGGASVKNADGVRNVLNILNLFEGDDLVVVVSAIGKTTNLLEKILQSYRQQDAELPALLKQLYDSHTVIARDLLEDPAPIFAAIQPLFDALNKALDMAPSSHYDYDYDRIVSFGELLSTRLVSTYLAIAGTQNRWLDARKMLKTDANFREGNVNFENSVPLIQNEVKNVFAIPGVKIVVTQGFIAGTDAGDTTTLGREGSDYSAAIFAYALDAESVTIWKDVPGVLNADPKFFADVVKLDEISYEEAIELSYYGATIIHPKTLKPLQNKNIPLQVKSFLNPTAEGTLIAALTPKNQIPSYIFKQNQILITLFPKDFSFIATDNLSEIFSILSSNKLKINVMQSTALSFSVCIDYHEEHLQSALEKLSKHYKVKYNDDIELITIRHYSQDVIDKVVQNRKIYLEQKSRTTLQLVVRGKISIH